MAAESSALSEQHMTHPKTGQFYMVWRANVEHRAIVVLQVCFLKILALLLYLHLHFQFVMINYCFSFLL
jgi:hypothetical protein